MLNHNNNDNKMLQLDSFGIFFMSCAEFVFAEVSALQRSQAEDKWPGDSFKIGILIELEHTNVYIFSSNFISNADVLHRTE